MGSAAFNGRRPQILRIARLIENNREVLKADDVDVALEHDAHGDSLLHKTVRLGSIVLMEQVLALEAINVNTGNADGDTMAHILCRNAGKHSKFVEIFRMLTASKSSEIGYKIRNNRNELALESIRDPESKA